MKLSLATKIFLGFSLVLAVFGAVPVVGVAQLNAVRDQFNAVRRAYELNEHAAKIETHQKNASRHINNIAQRKEVELQRALFQNVRYSLSRNLNREVEEAQSVLRRINRDRLSDQVLRQLDVVRNRFERLREKTEELDSALQLVLQSLELNELPVSELPEFAEVRNTLLRLAGHTRSIKGRLKQLIATQMLKVERDENSAIGAILWLTILAVVVGMVVTVLSLLALRPIRRLAEAARRISQGDFSQVVDVSTRDEFGLLAAEFNRMARSLARREEQLVRQQNQLEEVNRELRQSSIDLELMRLYNEHIIRSMHNGILVANPLGAVTTVNPAAERLWALDPGETIGRRLEELPIGLALSDLLTEWNRVLRAKERMMFEALEFEVPGRGQVLVDLYVSPLLGTDGDTQGVLLLGEDVTEKVRTKQALIQSERLATIGRMSALVAHEIRNPLSSIGLNTELLQDELDELRAEMGVDVRSIVRTISREVERLVEVTDEYLRFARLPKPNLHPERLNTILEDLLRFINSELEGARVELRHELNPAVGCVSADENQLRQAFFNLFKNSAESMPDGGVLTVSTEQANGVVRVRITDTGRGIDEDSLDKIFDPFFSTREGGTGLGLSLTQQIVNEHGGRITCESKPGEGTSFLVELPICQAQGESPARSADD